MRNYEERKAALYPILHRLFYKENIISLLQKRSTGKIRQIISRPDKLREGEFLDAYYASGGNQGHNFSQALNFSLVTLLIDHKNYPVKESSGLMSGISLMSAILELYPKTYFNLIQNTATHPLTIANGKAMETIFALVPGSFANAFAILKHQYVLRAAGGAEYVTAHYNSTVMHGYLQGCNNDAPNKELIKERLLTILNNLNDVELLRIKERVAEEEYGEAAEDEIDENIPKTILEEIFCLEDEELFIQCAKILKRKFPDLEERILLEEDEEKLLNGDKYSAAETDDFTRNYEKFFEIEVEEGITQDTSEAKEDWQSRVTNTAIQSKVYAIQ